MRALALAFTVLLVAACTTGHESGERAPLTLTDGGRVTYRPGDVRPLATRVRCLAKPPDARPVTALVPARGRGSSVIADGEAGYSVTLTITTHSDGTVLAVCD